MPQFFKNEQLKFGWKVAIKNLNKRRHLLPLVSYLILVSAIAFTFEQQASNANHNRRVLAQNCQTYRAELYGLLAQERPQIVAALRRHQITSDQAIQYGDQLNENLAKIQSIQCSFEK